VLAMEGGNLRAVVARDVQRFEGDGRVQETPAAAAVAAEHGGTEVAYVHYGVAAGQM
jgi:hypothetical protein